MYLVVLWQLKDSGSGTHLGPYPNVVPHPPALSTESESEYLGRVVDVWAAGEILEDHDDHCSGHAPAGGVLRKL